MKLKLLPMLAAAFLMVGCAGPKENTKPTDEQPPVVEPSGEDVTPEEPVEPSEPEEPVEPETPVEPEEPVTPEEPVEPEEPSEPEIIPNDGSLEHPWTVSEAYPVAAALADGENTTKEEYFIGEVTGEVSFYKGRLSFDITDGEQTLKVYNMNNAENKASWKEDQTDIAVGVTVIVAGALKNYKGTLEICYIKDVANCFLASIVK